MVDEFQSLHDLPPTHIPNLSEIKQSAAEL